MSRRATVLAAAALAGALVAGCADPPSMRRQPYHRPLGVASFFPDSGAARPDVPGTVARELPGDRYALSAAESLLASGRAPLAGPAPPRPVTAALLARGRERYGIFCAPCHGDDGHGDGMVARRGFPAPPSYHSPRLRALPDAYLFDVITGGRGKMPPYGPQVPPDDRWAIVAYVRALQLSQWAPADLLSAAERARLDAAGAEGRP